MTGQPRMTAAQLRRGAGRQLERTVHIEILRWLRANVSQLTWHLRNEGHRAGLGHVHDKVAGTIAGASDLGGVVEYGSPGVFFAVEVKRPGWRESEVDPIRLRNQRAFGRSVIERGGLFTFASSVEEVECWAREAGIIRPKGWRVVGTKNVERKEYEL